MQGLLSKPSYCPYCGETIELIVDTSINQQEYIEDCQVCCRPIIVNVQLDSSGYINLTTRSENE